MTSKPSRLRPVCRREPSPPSTPVRPKRWLSIGPTVPLSSETADFLTHETRPPAGTDRNKRESTGRRVRSGCPSTSLALGRRWPAQQPEIAFEIDTCARGHRFRLPTDKEMLSPRRLGLAPSTKSTAAESGAPSPAAGGHIRRGGPGAPPADAEPVARGPGRWAGPTRSA
jgi:hypothetical protein